MIDNNNGVRIQSINLDNSNNCTERHPIFCDIQTWVHGILNILSVDHSWLVHPPQKPISKLAIALTLLVLSSLIACTYINRQYNIGSLLL
jgi:hypothetical protein